MKFGVHSLVFSDRWDGETAPAICREAAEIGYDLIEVLMFDPATLDREATRRATSGSGACGATTRGAGRVTGPCFTAMRPTQAQP